MWRRVRRHVHSPSEQQLGALTQSCLRRLVSGREGRRESERKGRARQRCERTREEGCRCISCQGRGHGLSSV